MTTRTALSAATRAQRTNPVLCSSSQPPASSFQNLIANLELEIPATPTKQSVGLKSNRKKIAIFQMRTEADPAPDPQASAVDHSLLIYCAAIRNPRKALKT